MRSGGDAGGDDRTDGASVTENEYCHARAIAEISTMREIMRHASIDAELAVVS